LKKGTFTGDVSFFEWFNEIQMNTIERKTVQIMLLNEKGESEIIWTLTNAFPKQVQGTDLNSSSSDVAVESLVLAHEGLATTTA
jgi:phage tail-like protein